MSLALNVIHASRSLESVVAAAVGETWAGLSVADLFVILSIREHGGITAVELTGILNRDKTTISRRLSGLEREGLISARLDPLDGRQRVVSLTPVGEELAGELLLRLSIASEDAAESLSEDGVEAVEIFLQRLSHKVQ